MLYCMTTPMTTMNGALWTTPYFALTGCVYRPTHCCVIDNLMIVLMSYLGLCFWHYCAWEHLCLCTVAGRSNDDSERATVRVCEGGRRHGRSRRGHPASVSDAFPWRWGHHGQSRSCYVNRHCTGRQLLLQRLPDVGAAKKQATSHQSNSVYLFAPDQWHYSAIRAGWLSFMKQRQI